MLPTTRRRLPPRQGDLTGHPAPPLGRRHPGGGLADRRGRSSIAAALACPAAAAAFQHLELEHVFDTT
jgi:hypothetical protein